MTPSRRIFLKNGAISMAAIGASAYWSPGLLGRMALAAGSADAAHRNKVLICLFQRGAADGLSMVIPHGDPFYYQHRHDIALPRPAPGSSDSHALDLDGFFGLHPAMDALMPLYKAGHLAVIHACGSPSHSRSHFDMQDFMESAAPDNKTVDTGWLNRMMAARPEPSATPFRAVSMTAVLPRSLRGRVEALAIRDLSTFGVHALSGGSNLAAGFEGMYDTAVDGVLRGAGKGSFDAISLLKKANPEQYQPAHGVKYPQNTFGRSMMQVAQLIKADVGLEVAFVEMDGWDTHVNQGGAFGTMSDRLIDFSRGISSLFTDLGDRAQDVLLLTMSEFGRAARQNGNRGTDHGHATCFFAVGGNVHGGRVLGHWPGLAPEKLFEERDLAVTTDFRDVFAEAAVRHFGLEPEQLKDVFPNYSVESGRFRGFCP